MFWKFVARILLFSHISQVPYSPSSVKNKPWDLPPIEGDLSPIEEDGDCDQNNFTFLFSFIYFPHIY